LAAGRAGPALRGLPVEARRKTGVPILDGYLETFAHLGGRTGVLIARRVQSQVLASI
jgi:hypothetical protein